MRFTLLKIIGETVSSESCSDCIIFFRSKATPPGKKTAVSFLPTVECPTLPAVETGQRALLSWKWGLHSAKSVCFIIFANVPVHSGKRVPSRRGCRCPHSPAVPQAVAQTASIELAADLRRGLPHNLREGYACCTTGFGSPRFSTLESLMSFLGQTVAHRPQLSHLE